MRGVGGSPLPPAADLSFPGRRGHASEPSPSPLPRPERAPLAGHGVLRTSEGLWAGTLHTPQVSPWFVSEAPAMLQLGGSQGRSTSGSTAEEGISFWNCWQGVLDYVNEPVERRRWWKSMQRNEGNVDIQFPFVPHAVRTVSTRTVPGRPDRCAGARLSSPSCWRSRFPRAVRVLASVSGGLRLHLRPCFRAGVSERVYRSSVFWVFRLCPRGSLGSAYLSLCGVGKGGDRDTVCVFLRGRPGGRQAP